MLVAPHAWSLHAAPLSCRNVQPIAVPVDRSPRGAKHWFMHGQYVHCTVCPISIVSDHSILSSSDPQNHSSSPLLTYPHPHSSLPTPSFPPLPLLPCSTQQTSLRHASTPSGSSSLLTSPNPRNLPLHHLLYHPRHFHHLPRPRLPQRSLPWTHPLRLSSSTTSPPSTAPP